MTSRRNDVRSAIVLGIVSVLAIGLLTAESASARTKTNYYMATMTPSNGLVTFGTNTVVTFTITNCGAAFAPPSSCANAKGSAIDSIVVTLPNGWSPATLSATGLKLAPGAATTLSAPVVTTASSAGSAHSVGICVSDTTQCSYQPTNATLALKVPLKFTFTHSPIDGTPTTSLCNTAVQLTDAPAGTDNVLLAGIDVTLAKATGSLNPGLVFDSTNTPKTNTNGVATFGCAPNPAVGGPYSVIAVGQNADGVSIPSADSAAFIVYSHLNPCGGDCTGAENGNGGTHLDVNSDALGDLGTSFFDAGNGQYPAFGCDGVKKLEGRPDVLQATSDGDKTVVITWSKAVTLKFTDNGTPHWQVCMAAPAVFTTDANTDAVLNDAGLYEGTIPLCGSAFLSPDRPNPCMAISRNAAQEIATITLPSGWANGDPYFH